MSLSKTLDDSRETHTTVISNQLILLHIKSSYRIVYKHHVYALLRANFVTSNSKFPLPALLSSLLPASLMPGVKYMH